MHSLSGAAAATAPPLTLGAAMHLVLNLLLLSWRRRRSLAVERKEAMWSSVSSVTPSPSSGHDSTPAIQRAAQQRDSGERPASVHQLRRSKRTAANGLRACTSCGAAANSPRTGGQRGVSAGRAAVGAAAAAGAGSGQARAAGSGQAARQAAASPTCAAVEAADL